MPIQPVRPFLPKQPVRPAGPATAQAPSTEWGVDLPPVAGPLLGPAPRPVPPQPRPVPQPRPHQPSGPSYGPPPFPGAKPDRRPGWEPTPAPLLPGVLATNETYLNGRNLRYAIHGDAYVSIPYLSANLVDRTPEDALDLWKVGSYTFEVKAARIDVDERQLNGAIAGLLSEMKDGKVSKATVSLLDGNRVAVAATA